MSALSSSRRFWQAAAGLAVLVAGSCAAPPASAQVAAAAVPPGAARFWFYRNFFPGDTGGMPAIGMNGATIGYGLAGRNFYRDVPAGPYHLTVESQGQDLYQSQDVTVAPGQQIFVKIASLPSWEESARGSSRRGTYYVMLIPPQMAALELPQTAYSSGN